MYYNFSKVFLLFVVLAGLICDVRSFILLSHLRDAVLTAEAVVGNVLNNVGQLVQQFGSLSEFFNAAVEEHCTFRCPNGECSLISKFISKSLILYINKVTFKHMKSVVTYVDN